jgi:hypothetical protein
MHPRPAGRLASQPFDAEQLASSNNLRPLVSATSSRLQCLGAALLDAAQR